MKMILVLTCNSLIGDEIYLEKNYSIHGEYKGHRFNLDGEGFINILKMIPYMMIERIYTCLCCHLFQNCYFQHLNIPIPINYFLCHHGFVFIIQLILLIIFSSTTSENK